ncbi:hypothetical protein OAP14_10190 [Aliiglaciecola sp.]|nr:hypothetical protein [Aliiglaciecola sp.]
MEPQNSHLENPFVGLNAFEEKQRERFKGRDQFIQFALEKLHRKAFGEQPFLLLLGNSGAGKSSLLNAGILPALDESDLFLNIQRFHHAKIHPCDLGNDPIKALIVSLTELDDYPLFTHQDLPTLIRQCKEQPSQFIESIDAQHALLPSNQTAVISIRQLERVFMNEKIGLNEKHIFVDLIVHLSSRLGIFVISSLRSDFYYRLGDFPGLLWLKQNGGQLDILPPSREQLLEIVGQRDLPVSLQFEDGKDDQPRLDQYIANRAYDFPHSLPLLQFVLMQMYQKKSQSGLLNFSAYRNLGGLERAIAKITEQVYVSLDRSVKRHFSRVVNRLVQKSDRGFYERQWVNQHELLKSERVQTLIDAFTDVGVFSKYTDRNNEVFVSLTHDCLFEHWSRLRDTLDSHQKMLVLKQSLESQASDWKSATRPSAYLLTPGKALDEGELVLKQGGSISSKLRALIEASKKRAQRKKQVIVASCVVLVMLFGFMLNNAYTAKIAEKNAQSDLVQSHELIEFLIDDEAVQLEKIGRLDLMQGGSQRSFEYLSKIAPVDDSTSAKQSRSRTFYQIGKVFLENGRFAGAIEAFEKTLELDNELVAIHPNGFDYHLELAQANYWIGTTHLRAGDVVKAEQYFLFYQKNAFDLVELRPDNAMAKMELSRAYFNLAQIASYRNQPESAMQNFLESVKFGEKGKSAADTEVFENIAYAYKWLSSKYTSEMKLTESLDMLKGETRIRGFINKRENDEQAQLNAALTAWELSQTQLLLGQRNQAQNTLIELVEASSKVIIKGTSEIQWKYIQAFSLSSLAQAALIAGKNEVANQQFQKSFAVINDLQQIADNKWSEAFYQRQYWYARMHHGNSNEAAFNATASVLNMSNNDTAQTWKLRLASLTQSVISRGFGDPDFIDKPTRLIAELEYMSIQNDLNRLQRLWTRVPQEMWVNADLQQLRPTIRQQLRQDVSQ